MVTQSGGVVKGIPRALSAWQPFSYLPYDGGVLIQRPGHALYDGPVKAPPDLFVARDVAGGKPEPGEQVHSR